ncbi:uncharacterized protein RCO7_07680 [Rhynchosporium graminicola]|uniref:Uncharacterized protein n=1 Tax=Rhynchosporium graminicola TaxID=2792576 RepID=A0A1E1LPU1_9HELO|nr:uncharacterized protein RCO7_07680 [Rhynchosporium commune]
MKFRHLPNLPLCQLSENSPSLEDQSMISYSAAQTPVVIAIWEQIRENMVSPTTRGFICARISCLLRNISTESNKKFLAKNGFFFRWYMLG